MAHPKFTTNPDVILPRDRRHLGKVERRKRLAERIFPRPQNLPKTLDMGPPPDLTDGEMPRERAPERHSSRTASTEGPNLKALSDSSIPNVLRLNQISERYSVHRITIYRWYRSGAFPQPDFFIGRYPMWYGTTVREFEQACRRAEPSSNEDLQSSRKSW